MIELAVIATISIGVLVFVVLLAFYAWVGFWDWYDDRMQESKRIANEELDAAYRTGSFYVPYTMTDMKDRWHA